MQIKDYITKNLPSLNWNILPQIFAENGVEMNEEIEAYLRNTPENTNWNVVESLSGKGETEEIILLDWTSFRTYSDGDSSDQFYASLTTVDINFDTTLVQEGEAIKIIIKDSTDILENIISNVIILTSNGYYYYEEPFGTSFQLSYTNNQMTVYCCDGTPFIGALDEWTAPNNWENLQVKIIKL